MSAYTIKPMEKAEMPDALRLVGRVFQEFVAPEYSPEGIKTFMDYIQDDAISKLINEGTLRFWVCVDGSDIVGVIAMRDIEHVSLMFVDSRYHRKGIARRLFDAAMDAAKKAGVKETTVNSSLYAADFYRALGYQDTDAEQTVNGIRFIPMAMPIG